MFPWTDSADVLVYGATGPTQMWTSCQFLWASTATSPFLRFLRQNIQTCIFITRVSLVFFDTIVSQFYKYIYV